MPFKKATFGFLLLLLSNPALAQWDFEGPPRQLPGWTRTGTAFNNQPTLGDNIAARSPGESSNHQGYSWIGTYEDRPDPSIPLGTTQGDTPIGTLTSDLFIIAGSNISFLVGGGADISRVRAELLIRATSTNHTRYQNLREPDGGLFSYPSFLLPDGEYFQLRVAGGNNSERMERTTWPINDLVGEQARIRIVDNSTGGWGHINVDDFSFDGSTPVTAGDVEITGIEITQGIQVYPGNSIPLVGDKPTLLRVFVKTRDPGDRWDDIVGTVVVKDAATGNVIGRTLRTMGRTSARYEGSRRDVLADTVNFALWPEHTAATALGRRILFEVSVSSFASRIDRDLSNNHITQTISFLPANYLSVYAFSYRNLNNGPMCPGAAVEGSSVSRTDQQRHARYVTNVFPASALALRRLDYLPPPEFDNSDCQALIRAHRWVDLTMVMNSFFNREFRQRAYIFANDSGPHAAAGIGGWCCTAPLGNQVAWGLNDGGETTAHELAHSWGRPHTFDAGGFPRADGSLGDQVGVRLVLPPRAIPARGIDGRPVTYDIMSYSSPQWISPYSYCALGSAMFGSGIFSCPIAVQNASDEQAGRRPFLRVREVIALLNGVGVRNAIAQESEAIVHVFGNRLPGGEIQIFGTEVITGGNRLPDDAQDGEYELQARDQGGNVLAVSKFQIVSHEPAQGRTIPFSALVRWPRNSSGLFLLEKGNILFERKASSNSPKVHIVSSPGAGELVSGSRVIEWDAEDMDGDTLSFSVAYSPDGGRQWRSIDVLRSSKSMVLDFDKLPGSESAIIRITASDGMNAGIAISENFRVSHKGPSVNLSAVENKLSNAGPLATIAAEAFDSEDGPIMDPGSYAWRSNRDGNLGPGRWLPVCQLSNGRHMLTVTVKDVHGMKNSTSMEIEVDKMCGN